MRFVFLCLCLCLCIPGCAFISGWYEFEKYGDRINLEDRKRELSSTQDHGAKRAATSGNGAVDLQAFDWSIAYDVGSCTESDH